MHLKHEEKIFLITTAIEELWDTSIDVVFLHEGCCKLKREHIWKAMNGVILAHPFADANKAHESYQYIRLVYEKVLSSLAKLFNQIHGVNHELRYWRIILGPWLNIYIESIYERYNLIRNALEKYPNLVAVLLDEESFVTPTTYKDFGELITSDIYNLQLYTRVFQHFGRNFPRVKKISNRSVQLIEFGNETNVTLNREKNPAIVLHYPYFSSFAQAMLENNINCQLEFSTHLGMTELPNVSINNHKRSMLCVEEYVEDDFTKFLSKVIAYDIPQAYVEWYSEIKKQSYILYPKQPKAIFSAVSWWGNEVFNHWAAETAEQGTKLLGVQHGGNCLGIYQNCSTEAHVIKITDSYYSWGWQANNISEKIISMVSAPKLCGRGDGLKQQDIVSDILLSTTSFNRFASDVSTWGAISAHQYHQRQSEFAKTLLDGIKEKLRVRLYKDDDGWGIVEYWRKHCPDVVLEGWDIPFVTRINKCKLIVFDNVQTAFLEALVNNRPVIAFGHNENYKQFFNPEALPYIDALRAVGIFHDTPQSAATTINLIFENLEEWWFNPLRQKVRREYCEKFANVSSNWLAEWNNQFVQIANNDEPRQEEKNNLSGYINNLAQQWKGRKIVFFGANQVCEELLKYSADIQVLGIIDMEPAHWGKYLSKIRIDSAEVILRFQPDIIIITVFPHARVIESKLREVVPSYVNIINVLRDFPEEICRQLYANVNGDLKIYY